MKKILNVILSDNDFSCSVMKDGKAVRIPGGDHDLLEHQPFAVSYCGNDNWLFGSSAIRYAQTHFGCSVLSVYTLLDARGGIKLMGESFCAEDIFALLFSRMKKDAENYLGHTCNEFSFTVSNTFTQMHKKVIYKSLEKVGDVLVERLFRHTDSLAAYFYSQNKKFSDKLLTIYADANRVDFGLYDIGDEVIETIAILSCKDISANKFETDLVSFCLKKHKQKGFDTLNVDYEYLGLKCNAVLKEVTDDYHIYIPDKVQNKNSSVVELSYSDITKIFEGNYKAIQVSLSSLLPEYKNDELLQILRSRPIIIDSAGYNVNYLKMALGYCIPDAKPKNIREYQHGVAMGVALLDGVSNNGIKDFLLLDAVPLDLYVLMKDNSKVTLVEAFTTIPLMKADSFRTHPKGNFCELPFFEHNDYIGSLVIALEENQKGKELTVQILIDVGIDTTIKVSAKIKGYDNLYSATLPVAYLLPMGVTITSELEMFQDT